MPTSPYLSPTFFIGQIRIGTVEGASCVNMGNNYPTNFTSNKKHNQGFGSVYGDSNEVEGIRSALNDSDILDMFNGDENQEIPEWVRQMMLEQYEEQTTNIVQETEEEQDESSD
jgi:hypothetical protein